MAIATSFLVLLWHVVHCHDAVVILNQHVDLVFGLCQHCRGWSAAGKPIAIVPFTNLKTVGLVFEPSIVCSIYTYESVSDWRLCSKKFIHHSPPGTYINSICRSALLLCWKHVWLEHWWCWWSWAVLLSGATLKKVGVIFVPTFVILTASPYVLLLTDRSLHCTETGAKKMT